VAGEIKEVEVVEVVEVGKLIEEEEDNRVVQLKCIGHM
jgi:hypothetical protein